MNVGVLTQLAPLVRRSSATSAGATLEQRLARAPRCAFTRYLLACSCFDRTMPAQAVRHLMVAHHVEPALESAALLVFAGMNLIRRGGSSLLPVILETWEEYRRPEFDRHQIERRLLDSLAEPEDPPPGLTPLARQLWRLPIRTLRLQLREVLTTPNTARYGALFAAV